MHHLPRDLARVREEEIRRVSDRPATRMARDLRRHRARPRWRS